VQDFHGSAGFVYEDVGVTILHVSSHLVCYNAAERIKALAHIRGMRVQKEPIAVVQAEHPLPGQHDKSTEGLQWKIAATTYRYTVRDGDFASGLLDSGVRHRTYIPTNQSHFSAPVIDAYRHELTVLVISRLLAELTLPMIKAALVNICVSTKLAHGIATLQELLVDRPKVI